jgi:hypothetical protein
MLHCWHPQLDAKFYNAGTQNWMLHCRHPELDATLLAPRAGCYITGTQSWIQRPRELTKKAPKRFDKVNQRAWAHVRKHAQLNATRCEKSIIRIFDRMNFNTNEVLK